MPQNSDSACKDLIDQLLVSGLIERRIEGSIIFANIGNRRSSVRPYIPIICADECVSGDALLDNPAKRLREIVSKTRTLIEGSIEQLADLLGTEGHQRPIPAIVICQTSLDPAVKKDLASTHRIVVIDPSILSSVLPENRQRFLWATVAAALPLNAISPYQAEGAVEGARFFARDLQVHTITELNEKNYVMVGIRRIGKSSVLRKVKDTLESKEIKNVILYTCEAAAKPTDVLRAIAHVLDPKSLREIVRNETGTWDRAEVERILRQLSMKGKRHFTLLLDEVGELVQQDRDKDFAFFHGLRASTEAGYLTCILAGDGRLDEIVKDSKRPLWNFGRYIPLSRFYREDVKRIIEEPMSDLGIAVRDSPNIVACIFAASGGHPQVVQYLLVKCIERIASTNTRVLEIGIVQEAIESEETMEYYQRSIEQGANSLQLIVMWKLALWQIEQEGLGKTVTLSTTLPELRVALIRDFQIPISPDRLEPEVRELEHVGVVMIKNNETISFGSPIYARALYSQKNLEARLLSETRKFKLTLRGQQR